MHNSFKTSLSVLVSAILAAGASSALAQNVTLSLAHVFPDSHPGGIHAEKLAELVEERTSGEVKINVLHGGVLGSEADEIQQLQAGNLDMALLYGVSNFQNLNPRLGVEELPFIFADSDHAHRAYDGEYGDTVTDILAEEGFIALSYWENGLRHFTNSVRPIVEPEDMSGIRFRSAEIPIRLEMFELLGASAIPMGFNELFTALQQGTVGGQENPISLIHANNFDEVQDYLSLSGHIYNAAVLTASPAAMAKLTPEQQEILRDTGQELKVEQRDMIAKQNETLLIELEESGMEINEINTERFKEIVLPLWESFGEENGDDLMQLIHKENANG
jgi:tripartite ATP-independent transporter DctP family solute receptor